MINAIQSIVSSEFPMNIYCADLIDKKSGIIFIISSKTGRNISKYSKHQMDREVMFLPGTKFKITNHYVSSIIALGQANIRESTFKIKDSDIQKA